jgi:hypothetical protein|nr:hypothetical protein [uncultured Rhodopila sp.]
MVRLSPKVMVTVERHSTPLDKPLSGRLNPLGFNRPSIWLWALRQAQKIVRRITIRLSFEIFSPFMRGDHNVNLATVDADVKIPFVGFDSADCALLVEVPPSGLAAGRIYPADALYPFVGICPIALSNATNPNALSHIGDSFIEPKKPT